MKPTIPLVERGVYVKIVDRFESTIPRSIKNMHNDCNHKEVVKALRIGVLQFKYLLEK